MTIPMMTKETFAGGCIDFCNNLNSSTPQDQRDACDAGSFAVCQTANDFETNANCKPFIDRIYAPKPQNPKGLYFLLVLNGRDKANPVVARTRSGLPRSGTQ